MMPGSRSYAGWCGWRPAVAVMSPHTLYPEVMMSHTDVCTIEPTATRDQNAVICGSLELSTKNWLLTVLLPGSAKMSKFTVSATDGGRELLGRLSRLREKVEKATGAVPQVV